MSCTREVTLKRWTCGDHGLSSSRARARHGDVDEFLTFTRLLNYTSFLQPGARPHPQPHPQPHPHTPSWYPAAQQQQLYSPTGNRFPNCVYSSYSLASREHHQPIYTSADVYSRAQSAYRSLGDPAGSLRQPGADRFERFGRSTSLVDLEEDTEEASQADTMALTSGKKLCKLDAICAKLKKINNEKLPSVANADSEILENGSGKGPEEEATDLSVKCLNNNIIGKIDLHNAETQDDAEQGLDLSKPSSENHTEDAHPENSNNDSPTNTSEQDNQTSENSDVKLIGENDKKEEFTIPTPIVCETPKATGSSRRKSRKAAAPRNISQVRDFYGPVDEKDELAEYEINNLNTNFPPEEGEDGETEGKEAGAEKRASASNSADFIDEDSNSSFIHSDKSLNHSNSSRNSLNSSLNASEYTSPSGVLDLSVHNKPCSKSKQSSMYDSSGEDDFDDEGFFHRKRKLVIDERQESQLNSKPPSSLNSSGGSSKDSGAAHLKDFAENTMNELISMYGFGGHPGGDVSKHIPMKSFSDILQQAQAAQLSTLAAMQQGMLGGKLPKPMVPSSNDESDDGSQPLKGIYASLTAKSGHPASSKLSSDGGSSSKKLQNDRFTTSSSFIKAMFNSQSQGPPGPGMGPGGPGPGGSSSQPGGEPRPLSNKLLPNYSKYLKRYNAGTECGGQHCKDLGYKEHYHCIDCSFQVFIKKEEMVRHYKWHKKREESLQHGFLRFSPLDNCTKRFGPCTHNGKQTHYHCLQNGCDKVYISTSDVQMHANYHRKDSAIMSEGFQRFRATEDCGTLSCAFYGQRTTHFHCLRSDCKFTFKNKADMEKHKSYHQKDEVLGRDGFKKFMKYEHCNFNGCRYSKVSNHIHCIRSSCDYVLHSTAQLYSHKRKHERRDFESAYKRFRDNHAPGTAPHQNKPILPRPTDLGMLQQQLQAVNGKTPIPALASLSGLKRPADVDLSEHMELKKPKLEPLSDIDSTAPPSPGGFSDDQSSTADNKPRSELDHMDAEASNMSECSSEPHGDGDHLSDSRGSEPDGINLNGSLSLPIQTMQLKTEPKSDPCLIPSAAELSLSLPSSPPAGGFTMQTSLTNALVSMNPGTLMTIPSTLTGASTQLQPPKSIYTERREKDDSWKTYLVRYTANDPCNPRCQYLYKDHYHCKVDGCLVLFKSKDGVREHARFHELQDRITPIAYRGYESGNTCPEECQYSEKEKHFHCIWTGCTHVVPYVGPTFGRLEHYRIHEYARAAAGKSYNRAGRAGAMDDNSMRRRGRPPKYPKVELPKIPKVELTEEEIRQSHVPVKDSEISSNMKVINGFRIFTPDDPCPDEQCNFVGKVHFHCARPRCFTITDRTDVLNLHAKDFHSFVNILEGFEFFDRAVSCRRMNCSNNQTTRHFHCTRPKCDYSFIRHSTMAQHQKKHEYSENGGTSISPTLLRRDMPIKPLSFAGLRPDLSDSPISLDALRGRGSPAEQGFVPVSSMKQIPNIPLLLSPGGGQVAGVPQGSVIIPPGAGSNNNFSLAQMPLTQTHTSAAGSPSPLALAVSSVQALPASVTSQQAISGISSQLLSTVGGSPLVNDEGVGSSLATAPLTVLLQRGVNQIPMPSWNELKAKMHYAISQNCGRPFCKLKKKDHYHCYDCNQAFSDPARLRSHIGKHGIKLKRSDIGDDQPIKPTSIPSTETLVSAVSAETKVSVEGIETDMDPDEAKCLADNQNQEYKEDSDAEDELKSSSSLNLNPSTFSEMITKAQEQNKLPSDELDDDEEEPELNKIPVEGMIPDMDGNQSDSDQKVDLSSHSGRKRTKPKHEGFMNSGEINLSKQRRSSASPKGIKMAKPTVDPGLNGMLPRLGIPMQLPSRSIKDDSVPDGYSRWRYNEECCYPKCAYRHSVTHFHCNREDCGYGFSDRSRLVQHTLRHERIDSITGGELQQYRINQDCEKGECEFNRKMSHFHCKRCPYSCTDSSKVLTHRKYHAKLDNIASQGFQKYTTTDNCGNTLCPYIQKQTHFHCLKEACNVAVLGVPQMASHKAKHDVCM